MDVRKRTYKELKTDGPFSESVSVQPPNVFIVHHLRYVVFLKKGVLIAWFHLACLFVSGVLVSLQDLLAH